MNKDHEYVMKVLQATSFDYFEQIFWRTDGEYAPITFIAICNDVFYWGGSDSENITPENIHILEESIKDVNAINEHGQGILLFCARVRKMRPQGAIYKGMSGALVEMLNECGPEREVGIGNPVSQA